MRKTKIICTLGPASNSETVMEALITGGMNAARFNFSHGDHDSHREMMTRLRRVASKFDAPIATVLDTKGPEIRIKDLIKAVELETGGKFTLTTREISGDEHISAVTYENLHLELSEGGCILIDDGVLELRVEKIDGRDILCAVINGGILSPNKSINIPGTRISLPSLTEQDKKDIRFAAENDFDYIAASFVRRASDLEDVRACLCECGGGNISVIAKIENSEGVSNMDEIIESADGVMVARGDLGVEIPAHEVPVVQRQIVSKCTAAGKPVIVATQMLDSMIRSPRPTRAEISDVANAVFELAGCVMLSGETASGKYPAESLRVMVDTLEAAENSMKYWNKFNGSRVAPDSTIGGAISHSCCLSAMDLGAKAILAATAMGYTARMISRYRPGCEIIAMTTSERVRRQLSLYWGVKSYMSRVADSTDGLFENCVDIARAGGDIEKGDIVIITAGVPLGISGTTNLIKVQVVE